METGRPKGRVVQLTITKTYAKITQNNIRKAMTEKSSLEETSRESSMWWKLFMRKLDENHSRAVTPKLVSVTVCLR